MAGAHLGPSIILNASMMDVRWAPQCHFDEFVFSVSVRAQLENQKHKEMYVRMVFCEKLSCMMGGGGRQRMAR